MTDISNALSLVDQVLGEPNARKVEDIPLAQGPGVTPGGAARAVDAMEENAVGVDARHAVTGNPDARAKSLDLSGKTGLPVDTVERNQADVDAKVRAERISAMAEKDPTLRKFLVRDPENVKLAHDDIDALTRISDVARSVPGGLVQATGMGLSGMGDLALSLRRLSSRGINSVFGDDTISNLDYDLPWWLDPAKAFAEAGEEIKALAENDIMAPADRQNIATDIAGGVGQVAGQIALSLVNPALAVTQMLGQGADMQADAVDAAGADSAASDLAILAGAGVTAITEKMGLDAILNRVPPAIKNRVLRQLADVTVAGGIEAAQEVIEGIGHNLVEYSLYNPDVEIFEGLDREAIAAGGTGVIVRGLVNAAVKGRQVVDNRRQQQEVEGQVERLRALNTEAGQSKLRERARERLEDYIKEATGEEVVQLDADTFFQSAEAGGQNPVALMQKMGIAEADIAEALGSGGDITIPVSSLSVALEPEEFEALAMDLRFGEQGATAREASGFDIDMAKALEEMRAEVSRDLASEQDARANDPEAAVFDQVYDQLVRAGMTPDTARTNASMHGAFAKVLGERYGEDAISFYREKMGLGIERSLPGQAAKMPTEAIDLVIERARSGERIKTGKPLIQALKDRGGILAGSPAAKELAARGITAKTMPGLVRKTGRPGLDNIVREAGTAFELLAEDGSGNNYADINDVIAAIEDEFRGSPRLTQQQQDDVARLDDPADALADVLDRYVDDWKSKSRDEIKALLDGEDLQGRVFNQPDGAADVAQTRLTAVHNLTEGNLIFSDKMGGIAVPSIAVSTEDAGDLSGFGNISLIGRRDLVDPAKEAVFSADAYSARFPKPEYPKVKSKVAQSVVDEFRTVSEEFDDRGLMDAIWDNAVNHPNPEETIRSMLGSTAAKVAFLRENGGDVPVSYRDADLYSPISNTAPVRDYFASLKALPEGWEVRQNGERDFAVYDDNGDAVTPSTGSEDAALRDLAWTRKEQTKEQFAEAVRAGIEEKVEAEGKGDADLIETLRDAYADRMFNDDGLVHIGPGDRIADDQRNIGKQVVDSYATRDAADAAMAGREGAFKSWVDGKVLAMYEAPYLVVGRKKVPYTLNNIVAGMTRGNRIKGQEDTMTFGGGRVRAAAAKRFTNLEKMRKEAAKSIRSEAETEEAIKASEIVMSEYRDAVAPHWAYSDTWGALDASMRAIAKWTTSKQTASDMRAALRSEDFKDLPDGVVDMAVEAGRTLMETPVPYFEAKPQRAVDIGEFAGAVIPIGASQEVRDVLDKAGVPYREYEPDGGQSAQSEAAAAFRKELGGDVFFQDSDGPRAKIQFGDGETIISLFENANMSTFAHETGHFFLESLRYLEANGNAQAAGDMAVLTEWFGTRDIGVDQHEQFARGFEAYLFEGKAPSPELQGVFERFAAWLMSIYKAIGKLDVTLNSDVRAVMDRLLATDAEIEAAQAANGMVVDEAIIDAATEEEAQAIMAAMQRAEQSAREEVRKKVLANVQAEQSAEWKANYDRVREEVEDEVRNRPVYRAFDFLMGEQPQGMVDFEADAFAKLSRDIIIRDYGKDALKMLPRGKTHAYQSEGGLDPDDLARVFGYRTGQDLILALADIKGKRWQDAVAEETQERMMSRYGSDPTKDGTVEREAADAVLSDAHAVYMALEQKVLARKAGGQEMPAAVLRDTAIRLVREKAVRLGGQVTRYLAAERKASRASHEAAMTGDFAEALRQKQRQLLNHYMTVEAKKVRDFADETHRYVSRMASKKLDKSVVHPEYVVAMKDLAYAYGFGSSRPDAELAAEKVARVNEWSRRMQATDGVLNQPLAWIIETGDIKDRRDMTMKELRSFRATIKNLEHAGKAVSEHERAAARADFEANATALIDGAYANLEWRKDAIGNKTRIAPTKGQIVKDFFGNLDSKLLKVRQVVSWLDGDKSDGAWHRLILQPMQDAQTLKDDMTKQYVLRFMELKDAMPKAWQKKMVKRVYVPEINGQSMTWESLIAFALNTGNQSNMDKLRDGMALNDEQVATAMQRLTADDWRFVQDVWDMIESLYPRMNEVHKRLTGVELEKIVAKPREITSADGVEINLRGGYYPVIYDPMQSKQGMQNADAAGKDLFETLYSIPVTAQGHTVSRSGFKAPLLLKLDVIPDHVSQVIHDIAFREVIREVDKLTQSADVAMTVDDTLGRHVAAMFRPWLQGVANDRALMGEKLGSWDRVLRGLRNNTTMMAMGYKATTTFAQIAGFPAGMEYFAKSGGRRYLGRALRDFTADPAGQWNDAREKSGMMRHRMENMDREIRDGIRSLTQSGTANAVDWFRSNAFKAIGYMDSTVATMIWQAAYAQARDGGMSERDAIAAGDDAVILTQGGGAALDLAAVQRQSSEAMKFFTMFYSYFSAMYNRERDMVRQAKTEAGLAAKMNVVERYFWMIAIPAVLGELLAARWPDEDEPEAWAEWAAVKVAIYPLVAIPGVRDIVSGVESGFGYSLSPAKAPGDSITKLVGSVARAIIEDEYDVPRLIKDGINTVGYALGLPLGQLTKMGDALWKGLGEDEDLGPEEYLFGVKYRK